MRINVEKEIAMDTELYDHDATGAYGRFLKDPFLGYDTLEKAIEDCKATSQAEVVARILNGENVFVSGPAGSGKSTVVALVNSILEDKFKNHFIVAITASTGLAASNIGGKTIHSWSGLGIYDGQLSQRGKMDNEALGIYRAESNLKYADLLVVDEVSMLHAYYLDNVDTALKRIRKNDRPFGGVQVILMGDFMQLPPINPPSHKKKDGLNYGFAITSRAWKEADIKICYLDKVHRASDPDLKHMLWKISVGKPDEKTMQMIGKAEARERDPDKVYSVLFTTNKNVDAYNKEKLDENPNDSVYLYPEVYGAKKDYEELMKQHAVPHELEMKEGAVVIVTANNNEVGVFNGTVAKFVRYNKSSDEVVLALNDGRIVNLPKVSRDKEVKRTKSGAHVAEETLLDEVVFKDVVAAVSYFPIKLGYAITVHKSQGQTFDAVEVDLSKCFIPGLGYVALSRVRNANDLIISGFSQKALEVDTDSLKYSRYVKKKALENRAIFIENIEHYREVLTSPEKLETLWKIEDSGISRSLKDLNKK